MANTARGIILHTEQAVPLHPELIVIDRSLIPVHINVALKTVQSGIMRIIPKLNYVIALQLRNRHKALSHQRAVAIIALSFQRFCMDKNLFTGSIGHTLPILKGRELFFLMAVPAGFTIDLLSLRLIMTIHTGFMREPCKRRLAKLAVAFVAIHFIIGDVRIVAEFQRIFILFASAKKQQSGTGKKGCGYAVCFHNLTSNDVRNR